MLLFLGVTNHVPSQEENTKLTNVSTQINNHLQQILINTNASRANLVQYHNRTEKVLINKVF